MSIKRTDNYEFNEAENEVIGKLSNRMYWVAIVFLIFGGIKIFEGLQSLLLDLKLTDTLLRDMVQHFVLSIMYVIMGILTLSVSQSFKLVVNTEGSDIENMMNAVRSLTKLQTVALILVTLTTLSTLAVWIPFLLRRFAA